MINHNVAHAFFRAGKIEAWRRGIERIFEACAAASIPKPEFKPEQTWLWTVFNFDKKHLDEGLAKTTQEKILTLLAANPAITRNALAQSIGLTSDGIKYHLNKMKAAGLIRYVGPTKAGQWEVMK